MTDAELQSEEREVLISIYDGDNAFKEISPTTFQYMYGENEDTKSFLLEISWGSTYPTEKPIINMNTFYNRNLSQNCKDKIVLIIENEVENLIGSAMTYTLFERLKEEDLDKLLENEAQIDAPIVSDISHIEKDTYQETLKSNIKKEKLTKTQKRRVWDRIDMNNKGERIRGWNWVDIVKHLSQTGPSVIESNNVPNS